MPLRITGENPSVSKEEERERESIEENQFGEEIPCTWSYCVTDCFLEKFTYF